MVFSESSNNVDDDVSEKEHLLSVLCDGNGGSENFARDNLSAFVDIVFVDISSLLIDVGGKFSEVCACVLLGMLVLF